MHLQSDETTPSRLTSIPKKRDSVEAYPSYGQYLPEVDGWAIHVRGRVVSPRPDNFRKRMLMRVIRRVLRASDEQLTSPTFRERIRGFLMLTRRGRRIRVDVGGEEHSLRKKSKRSGMFQGVVHASAEALGDQNFGNDANPWHWFQVGAGKHGGRFDAPVQLIGEEGPSVISDIDDTIKWSDVENRRRLLANTFFHPFAEIEGMPNLYRNWAQQGSVFHYVSSSPWQLYEPLTDFLDEAGFPPGSFHLRSIQFRDPSVLQLIVARKRSKKRAIKSILKSFPKRQFVLVGDVGEKDPEIYGAIARRYRHQIVQLLVRKIPGSEPDPARIKKAFRGLPDRQWRVFSDASELEDLQASESGWKLSPMSTLETK